MNNRRKLIVAIGAGAITAPFSSLAQQQGNMPRIGLLWIDSDAFSPYLTAFREGLHGQGYFEGKNIQIEGRFLAKSYEQLSDAAAKLVRENVTLILCFGATATQAAAKATTSIPIVALTGNDPVKLGLAATLSRPGKNVTGITFISTDIVGKRLEVLKNAVPGIRHVGVVLSSASKSEIIYLRELEAAARSLNLDVRPIGIRTPEEIDAVIAGISRINVGGLVVVSSTMLNAHRKQIVMAVEKIRLPAIYSGGEYADEGGLMSYSPSITDGFTRASVFADKILKGAKPGDLPFEQPTKFELAINMKTAKALGIKIPNSILVRADKVIE